jgi:hypothetical protein
MGHMTRSGKLMANLELGNLGGLEGGRHSSIFGMGLADLRVPVSALVTWGEGKGNSLRASGWVANPIQYESKKKAYAEYLAIISPYSSSSSSSSSSASASFSSLHWLHIAVIIARAFGLYHSKQLCSLPAATGQENV